MPTNSNSKSINTEATPDNPYTKSNPQLEHRNLYLTGNVSRSPYALLTHASDDDAESSKSCMIRALFRKLWFERESNPWHKSAQELEHRAACRNSITMKTAVFLWYEVIRQLLLALCAVFVSCDLFKICIQSMRFRRILDSLLLELLTFQVHASK